MSLSLNEKITQILAGLALLVSVVSAFFTGCQGMEFTKEKRNSCRDAVVRFQSEISSKNDIVLNEAMKIKLDIDTSRSKLDDALIDYKRHVRLFEQNSICENRKPSHVHQIGEAIDSVRKTSTESSEISLDALIRIGQSVAQDSKLPECCE